MAMKHAPSRFAPMIFCSMARNMKSSSILMTRNFQPVAKSAHPAKQFEVDKPYLFHYFHPVVPPLDFIRPFPCLGIAQASLVSALSCMKTFIFGQHPDSKELELHIVLFSRLRGRSGSQSSLRHPERRHAARSGCFHYEDLTDDDIHEITDLIHHGNPPKYEKRREE